MFEDCTIALSKCIQSREFIQPNASFQLKRKNEVKLLTKEDVFYDEIQQNLNIENCEKLRFYAKGPHIIIIQLSTFIKTFQRPRDLQESMFSRLRF
jgi:hypothetical protein